MADNKSFLDFELPPLPKLPPKPDGNSQAADSDAALTAKEPVKRVKPPLNGDLTPTSAEQAQPKREKPPLDGDFTPTKLPEPEKQPDRSYSKTPLDDNYVPVEEVAHIRRVTAMGDHDLLASKKEEKPAEPEKPYEENGMIFTDDYDINAEINPTLDAMDSKPHKQIKLAPMSSAKQTAANALKEQIKMSDLQMSVGNAPVLEDLSDEYGDSSVKKKNLAEQDKLDSNEKKQLVRSMKENISYVPQGYNARASKRMYNKLMEEKNLKIAKKGMLISFIPVSLGIAACVLALLVKLNWGVHLYIDYAAFLGIIGGVLLLIKSKACKTYGMICYTLTLLVFLIPGLILYAWEFLNESAEATSTLHIFAAGISSLFLIVSLVILGKSEAVNMYYTTKFKHKKD